MPNKDISEMDPQQRAIISKTKRLVAKMQAVQLQVETGIPIAGSQVHLIAMEAGDLIYDYGLYNGTKVRQVRRRLQVTCEKSCGLAHKNILTGLPLTISGNRLRTLIINAHRMLRRRYGRSPIWAMVSDLTGHGSTVSCEICQSVGINPTQPCCAEELQVNNLVQQPPPRPRIVCLCGSTRFWREFQRAGLRETMSGRIVLSIGAASGTDDEHFGNLPKKEYERVKTMLDELHKRKIDLADEVLALNVGGYIGESTRSEIEYAEAHGKPVRYLESKEVS